MVRNGPASRKNIQGMLNMVQDGFILNHQMNVIHNEIKKLQYALKHAADQSVVEGVRYTAEAAVLAMFPSLSEDGKELFHPVRDIRSDEECEAFLNQTSAYAAEFPRLTEKQVLKLFPKNKKLKIPDVSEVAYDKLTYLGWTDVSTGKMFLVYPFHGSIAGVECRFSVSNKPNICALCNTPRSPEQLGFVTAVCKPGRSSSPDYYKSIGNYMCLDSSECNHHIRDVAYLEKFFNEVLNHGE